MLYTCPPTPDTRCSQKLWKVGVGRCPWAGGRGGPRAPGRLRFPQRSPVALRPSARVPGLATPGPALGTKSHPPASGCAGSRPRCHLESSHPWGRARGLSFSELKGLRPGSPERGSEAWPGQKQSLLVTLLPGGLQSSGRGGVRAQGLGIGGPPPPLCQQEVRGSLAQESWTCSPLSRPCTPGGGSPLA